MTDRRLAEEIFNQNQGGYLSDKQILAGLVLRKIILEPLPYDLSAVNLEDSQTWPKMWLRPSAHLLRLGDTLSHISPTVSKVRATEQLQDFQLIDRRIRDSLSLSPGQVIHGFTFEKIGIDKDIFGFIDGLNLLAQKFITIHTTSQTWNPGDGGLGDPRGPYPMMLEIKNDGPLSVEFKVGDPVAKLSFYKFPDGSKPVLGYSDPLGYKGIRLP